jgi:hypothetical protein
MPPSKKKSKKIPDIKDVLHAELEEVDLMLNWWLPKATDESATPAAAKTAVDVALKLITFKNSLMNTIMQPEEEPKDTMADLFKELASDDE